MTTSASTGRENGRLRLRGVVMSTTARAEREVAFPWRRPDDIVECTDKPVALVATELGPTPNGLGTWQC